MIALSLWWLIVFISWSWGFRLLWINIKNLCFFMPAWNLLPSQPAILISLFREVHIYNELELFFLIRCNLLLNLLSLEYMYKSEMVSLRTLAGVKVKCCHTMEIICSSAYSSHCKFDFDSWLALEIQGSLR